MHYNSKMGARGHGKATLYRNINDDSQKRINLDHKTASFEKTRDPAQHRSLRAAGGVQSGGIYVETDVTHQPGGRNTVQQLIMSNVCFNHQDETLSYLQLDRVDPSH